jgi:hypothetical protein
LFEERSKYIVLVFVELGCFPAEGLALGVGVRLASVDEFAFGKYFQAGVDVSCFAPYAIGLDVGLGFHLLLRLPQAVLVVGDNQCHDH